ncbi:HlyD family efflux transporter periplasmic adaptor subunit [Marinobacter salinexigens]|uniref:HlyD family efflux transporter periplasmic adaptor subunit n=1 Tax=Marinobacter salinexigens TaxID=2919747 RepID=A0A5B0VKD6_9GAMM|nr:HlyD family efflux transporter periplasmic adaptor subunit [Marinobacter salinexigens]KAA1174924.1 HlyD family efflux transporter periplasmic adaptor subunit [Marinobacter salinexigens]
MVTKGSVGKLSFWAVVVSLAGVVLFIALRPDPVWVDLATVTRGELEVSISEEGKTRVKDRYLVSSPVAGYLHRVPLEVGDRVSPGQLLTEVDPMPSSVLDARSRAEAEARVAAAQSALNSTRQKVAAARAEAELAEKELVRLQSLSADRFVSKDRLEQAESAADRANAILRSARFDEEVMIHELKAARTRLEVSAASSSGNGNVERVGVRSPVEGAVLQMVRKSEGVIQAGEPIVEVGDPAALEVVVDVLSFDAVNLAPGVAVRLSGWGGKVLEAVVRRVEPVGFEDVSALGVEEQRVKVVADIVSPTPDWSTLGDGYRVDATFVLWSGGDVLSVPTSAIFDHLEGKAVFRVEDEVAVLTEVTIGRGNGLDTVITEGLEAGMTVIRHPDRQVEDGARVRER